MKSETRLTLLHPCCSVDDMRQDDKGDTAAMAVSPLFVSACLRLQGELAFEACDRRHARVTQLSGLAY